MCVCVKSRQNKFLLLLQTDTKPVQMMNLEATFCMGHIDGVNCKIIELPFQNKHLSMLILLPKDAEDGPPGLEQVRSAGDAARRRSGARRRVGGLAGLPEGPLASPNGLQRFQGSFGVFLLGIKTANIDLVLAVPGTLSSHARWSSSSRCSLGS